MPPSKKVLENKIKRTNYLSRLLKNASTNNLDLDNPEQHGWLIEQDEYVLDFFSGPQYPDFFTNNCDSERIQHDNMDEDDNMHDVTVLSSDDENELGSELDE